STLLQFHRALVQRKYRLLFSPKRRGRSGPKGPPKEFIEAIVEMKRRNPSRGCPRIAQQITLAFDVSINKDVVRRILAAHYHPSADSSGPSWLTYIGHAKDSLRSLDLFRIHNVANTLGSRRHGPIHTTHYRVWCSSWHCGWRRIM